MSFHDQRGFAPGDRVLAKVSPDHDEWWPARIVRFAHLPTFTDPPLRIVPEIIFERDPYGEGTPCEWENIQPESVVDKLARLA